MKILHFHYGTDGGAERFFVNLANEFHKRGVDQRFYLRPGRTWKADLVECGPVYEGHFRRVSISQFFLKAKIRRTVDEFQPDVLMAWRPRMCRLMKPFNDRLRVVRLGDYTRRLEQFAAADQMVVNTPGIQERVLELGWGKPVDVISNFTRFKPCTPIDRAALNTPKDAFLVVGVGRFVERKGMHTLIDAVAKVPGAWLWLVGDGEDRAALEKQVADRGISDRVRFAGWQADPSPYLAAANVFVMPSSHEPLGNVILEAWSVGKPVVSSRSEGPLWMIQDGENGLLVDIGDADGFAAALVKLKNSPDLAAKLVAGGTKTLNAEFSVDGVTDAYLRYLSESLAQRRS
jgi:glycosyltransferase involved in cell wall biosynthesis